jgi:cytochrome P450
MSQFGQPVVCVLGLERGQRLLSGHGASLAGATLPHNRLIPTGFLRFMHAETHKAIAPLFRASFASVVSAQYEGQVRAIYREALALLAADSASLPGGVYARPYLERAVFESLAWLLYGLELGDPRVKRLEPLIFALHPADPGGFAWRRRTRAVLAGISALMLEIQQGWTDAAAVTPSALKSLVDSVPEAIANPVYAWNFAMITRIAHGDVTGLNDWILKMCCDYPWALDAVRGVAERDMPDGGGATGLKERAARPSPALCIVMETLRLEQSEFLYRRVAKSFEFEGFVFPKGWLIRLLIQESHRDPSVFENPDQFDPQRFLRRKYSRSEYAPFGADAHGCMGFQLAQLLGSILVEELARYDCRVVSDGPLEHGNRHRHHWRPSPRLRILLTSRNDSRDSD